MVTMYQILSPMAFNLGVEFPPSYEENVAHFDVFNLDPLPSLNLDCMFKFDYINGCVTIENSTRPRNFSTHTKI